MGEGANNRPKSLLDYTANLFGSLLIAMFFLGAVDEAKAQVGGPCIALACNKFVVNIAPLPTALCGGAECNRYYFQVSLTINGFTPQGNPSSFNLCYEDFSVSLGLATNPIGGLSSINQNATEDCLPAYYAGALGFDPGNIVTFNVHCTSDGNMGCAPPITFVNNNGQSSANLFVIAVDAVPGEVLTFNPLQSLYTYPPNFTYCNNNLIWNFDEFTVPSLGMDETDVCLAFDAFDYNTGLLPVLAKNIAVLPSDIGYLAFSFTIHADNIMDKPVLKNFVQTPVEQRIDPIPGTNDWKGYVKFNASPGIAVPAQGGAKLFDIEIKGPVNESLMAGAEVCFVQGQMRNGSNCKNACLSPDCAQITFDGDEPCNPDFFTVVSAQAVQLGSYFTVVLSAPMNCVNGVTVRESMVDVASTPPGGDGCVANVFVTTTDFPLCTPMLAGWVRNSTGVDIDDVDVVINRTIPLGGCPPVTVWPNNAPWSWCACDVATYRVRPQVKFNGDAWLNGVTTFDLVLISKHVLGFQPFTSLYQYIAADGSGNQIIDPPTPGAHPLDIIELRKLILGIYQVLPNNNSWRYLDAYAPANLPADPLEPFNMPPEQWVGNPSDPTVDFVAVKVGDVNNTHNTDLQMRPAGELPLRTEAVPRAAAGEYVSIPIRYEGDVFVTALQLGLRFDSDKWEYVGFTTSDVLQVSEECFNLNNTAGGEIRFVWFSANPEEYLRHSQALFYLTFRAKRAIKGDPMPVQIDDDLLHSLAFSEEGDRYGLSMEVGAEVRRSGSPANQGLSVSCFPNPTSGAVTLTIETATDAASATVWAYNAFGSRLMRREIPLTGQTTAFNIQESTNWPAGLYVWKVKVGDVKTEGRLLKQ